MQNAPWGECTFSGLQRGFLRADSIEYSALVSSKCHTSFEISSFFLKGHLLQSKKPETCAESALEILYVQ